MLANNDNGQPSEAIYRFTKGLKGDAFSPVLYMEGYVE